MIIQPPIKELCSKVDCRYTLAIVAAKRARQIVNEHESEGGLGDKKPVSMALREINEGSITYRRKLDEEE